MKIKEIGSKDFQAQVHRYRRETKLAKAGFFALPVACIALFNVLLFLGSTSLPSILSAIVFDVALAAFYLLMLLGSMRVIGKRLGLSEEFRGKPECLREIGEVVEEMSLATGVKPVKLLFINDGRYIPNAFSFKRKGRGVIVLNRALWDELTTDELRAVVAHELAHVHTGDAGNNTLMMPFEYVNNYQVISPERPGFMTGLLGAGIPLLPFLAFFPFYFIHQDDISIGALWMCSLFAVVILFAVVMISGVLLTSLHARSREFLADALAMQWTLDPEALTGAIEKIRGMMKHNELEILDDLLFVSVRSKKKKKGFVMSDDLEPSVDERLANLQALTIYPLVEA